MTSATAQVTVAAAPVQDFTFGLNTAAGVSSSQTVAQGADATYSLMLAPDTGGFSAPITLTATGLPAGATFTFSPATITLSSSSTPVTLTIHTAASSAMLRGYGEGVAALGLLLMPFAGSRRLRKAVRQAPMTAGLFVLLSLGSVCGLFGCGGHSTPPVQTTPNTPSAPSTPQSYTITVKATSGAISHSTTVGLTVQ